MMKLNVSALESAQEQAFEFNATAAELDAVPDSCTIEGSVVVSGTGIFTGSAYRIEGTARCHRSFVCDRCLGDFTGDEVYSFAEEFRREGSTADNRATVFTGDIIDIGPLVRDTVLSSQPLRNLCRDDCKGLCLKCGADLNKGDCGCDRRVVDPRLAALQDLIK